jgi:hypothetical protein
VLVVHATKKLRDRLRNLPVHASENSTTLLGDWYATAVFWRPTVCMFVNEATLLPVLVPLAPAATLPPRFTDALCVVLRGHGVNSEVVDQERREMTEVRLAPTANRSVVGVMNEFTFLADAHRDRGVPLDLLGLSLRLAGTPCGPLYQRHVSPDRELAALVDEATADGVIPVTRR